MTDIRAAAERLRAHRNRNKSTDQSPYWDMSVTFGPGEYAPTRFSEYLDSGLVLDAYLAEHPADDDEPVTEEWFNSIGILDSFTSGRNERRFELCNGVRVVGFPCEWPRQWEFQLCVEKGGGSLSIEESGDCRTYRGRQ